MVLFLVFGACSLAATCIFHCVNIFVHYLKSMQTFIIHVLYVAINTANTVIIAYFEVGLMVNDQDPLLTLGTHALEGYSTCS